MNPVTRRLLFGLFFLSGFSSLVYQVVWTRMAFASFGIITPVLSVVLSVFMLGLAVGSWLGGGAIAALTRRSGLSALVFYAGAELLIGLGAFAVPRLFAVSERILLPAGQMDSLPYLLCSALALAISIFPWCVCMGTTFPFMMGYFREHATAGAGSFSFLYLANVLGAMSGTFCTAVVLVETLGFQHTLWVAAGGNFTIAILSVWLARVSPGPAEAPVNTPLDTASETAAPGRTATAPDRLIQGMLFATGFTAMAMEVVWTRAFAVVLKTQVYSFALIVFTYLGATFLGSLVYRRDLRRQQVRSHALVFSALAIAAFLPVLVNDPRLLVEQFWVPTLDPVSALLLLGSIVPFCALLGYLTPGLIDEYAGGQPKRAGRAYAMNVVGCILGPLVACYLLLPLISERQALLWLGLPFVAFWLVLSRSQTWVRRVGFGLVLAGVLLQITFGSETFEGFLAQKNPHVTVRRDYLASVISFGGQRSDKMLLVNGFGMTILTPITKFIAHLPLAYHQGPPKTMLVICFGMGTTFRSALSWGDVDVTAVELVPSVTQAFGFYHPDAGQLLQNPHGHIVIDDGRRYLKRCAKTFDVIVVDPPPPVEAAGSSLLFSRDFYALAKHNLNPHGILQMWFPGGEGETLTTQAVIRSLNESFPYVRCFPSTEGWGFHLLASLEPIPALDAAGLAARMPAKARQDLVEWNEQPDAAAYLASVITNEYSLPTALNPDLKVQVTDDRPFNEYFLLRQLFH